MQSLCDVIECNIALMYRPMEIRVMPRALRCLVASLPRTTAGAGRRGHEQTEVSRFSRDVAQLAAAPLQPLMQRLHKTATKAVETACQRPSAPVRSACASRVVAVAVRRQSQRRPFCPPPFTPLLTPGRGDTNDTQAIHDERDGPWRVRVKPSGLCRPLLRLCRASSRSQQHQRKQLPQPAPGEQRRTERLEFDTRAESDPR